MKNYIKNFGQFQKLNEQAELEGGGLEELATAAGTILSNKYGSTGFKTKGSINPMEMPFTEIKEEPEGSMLYVRWYNPGEAIDLQIEVPILDKGNGKYHVSYIDTFGTGVNDEGVYYICSAEARKGENIGAIVNKEAVIEIIEELIKHQELDWSKEGPLSIPLKSQPDVTLMMDAYYD